MADYFIAPGGIDSDPGTMGSPRLTLPGGIALLSPQDTLNLRTGTYVGGNITPDLVGRGGSSWINLTKIQAYANEIVTITSGLGVGTPSPGQDVSYFLFSRLIVDGGMGIGGGANGGTISRIKLDSCEIMNSGVTGLFVGGSEGGVGNGDMCWIINCNVHGNGGNTAILYGDPGNDHYDHAIYVSSANNIVEFCAIHDNNHGYGIHNYGGTPNNNIYRFNKIYNNGNTTSTNFAILLTTGSNNVAHNNLVLRNANGADISGNNALYNNVFYGNVCGNPSFAYPAINRDTINALAKNNIIMNNTINSIVVADSLADRNRIGTE